MVGVFSTQDPDAGGTFTYSLVSGASNNNLFAVSGTNLKTTASFNFETQSNLNILVRSTDSGSLYTQKVIVITVTNVNESPTNILLSSVTLAENMPSNTVVGGFSTQDPDVGDVFSYSLVSGSGSSDNVSFVISGSNLLTATSFNYESQSNLSIRVQSMDSGGLYTQRVFAIAVTNVNETPFNILLSNAFVAENQPSNALVGVFSTQDPDSGVAFVYSLTNAAGGVDNALFSISGSNLLTVVTFDYETRSNYSVCVQSRDSGGLFTQKVFSVIVTNVNEQPMDIMLSGVIVEENLPSGTEVGSFSTLDPEAIDAFTYLLVAGSGDNSSFVINGSNLLTAVSFNYEAKSNFVIRVQSTDSGGLSTQKVFEISVKDVNEQPVLLDMKMLSVSNVSLQWSSITNHTYSIYYSTNLAEGFSILNSNLNATPTINSYTDLIYNLQKMFWIIKTEQ